MLTILIATEIVLLFLLAWSTDAENDLSSAGITAVAIALAVGLTGTDPVSWFFANYVNILLGFVGWFAIGAVWSVVKWWMFVNSPESKEKIREAFERYQRSDVRGLPEFSKSSYNPFHLYLYRGKIARWIVWWPASVLWSLTYRLIRWTVEKVYEAFIRVYDSISATTIRRTVESVASEKGVSESVPDSKKGSL